MPEREIMSAEIDPILAAISFAARAHRHQTRKDGQTPYVAHVFRVTFVLRHLFGVTDPRILTAAVLHDTIEDTTTDCDDITGCFGPDVAKWVAALTKDNRLPDVEREEAYGKQLAAGGLPVCLCKLADVYDNMCDSRNLPPEKRAKSMNNARRYLAVFRPTLPVEAKAAFALVEAKLAEVAAGMTA
jgi:guanosine-3',5'-bis(diphosphate) 3'-pyrophosphohydrolase